MVNFMREFLNDENTLFNSNTVIDKSMAGKFYFFQCESCEQISSKAIYYKNKTLIYSFCCTKCTRKKTNLLKFGCENPFQSQTVKNKIKETTLDRYGVDNVNKLKSVRDKISNSRDEPTIQSKIKETFIKKYGVDNPQKVESIRAKTTETCFQKYGKSFYNRTKFEETMIERYGVKNALQIEGMQSHSRHRYEFDRNVFDSSWEMAYYIWLCDNVSSFSFHKEHIEYCDEDGNIHKYTPDFKVGNTFIEIKGKQFFKEGHLYNPYTKEFLTEYEQLLRDNNVMVISDCEKYIEYSKKKYGTNVFDFFKVY